MRTLSGPITAARLAQDTGVSPRSLYRDIDALRSAGARIEGERGYGYRLLEDPALPPQMLDQDEIEVLALGLAEVRAWGDPALARAADSVLAKIAATLPDERERQLLHAIAQVFHPAPRYTQTLDLAPLRAACWQERALDIRYVDGDGATSDRTILPLALFYTETCVTVLSWCCLREDFRMFRTDRMSEIRSNGTSFRPRRVPLLRDYLAQLQKQRGEGAVAARQTPDERAVAPN
ncbi:helix-turn-helix transcriptional regulator [Sphingomonas nostoxanthinifaciens]|uniref:helix-turn-helix transcriptional regulator n=1 Tax=Sphingomonas nostoxanthinifaciens TaxID=2872652 RepID=UPI0021D84AA6|nr:YafY family protein [Sphingomonas nostoxanthinifaciens]UAK23126.1 YafY family transcriptional regulator [Sphingomonas nostoxanthinifaciens]